MPITWLPKQNPELVALQLWSSGPAGELSQRQPGKQEAAPGQPSLLPPPATPALHAGVGRSLSLFRSVMQESSSKTSGGTGRGAVSGWLEQPSAHLLRGSGLLAPTHTCLQVCGLPVESFGRLLCLSHCVFRVRYRGPETGSSTSDTWLSGECLNCEMD